MNKKDVAMLITPIFVMLVVAIGLFFAATVPQRLLKTGDGEEKFNVSIHNVETGKWSLTTDRWLEMTRLNQVYIRDILKVQTALCDLIFWAAWTIFAGAIFQIGTAIHIRKRLQGT